MNPQWQILDPDPGRVAHLARTLNLAPAIAAVLVNRQLADPAAAEAFLHPALSQLPPPDLLDGLPAAVARITAAIRSATPILVFGDYDVDGVTGTALLVEFLQDAGARVTPYLPHRRHDGYGLQARHVVEQALAAGCGLIVTVDCGATSHEAVAAARAHAIDVVVTDHHHPGDVPLPAAAVVNPRCGPGDGPLAPLAGVGVAFYLTIALRAHLREIGFWQGRQEPDLRRLCDLVALGTVADMVPLVGVNRILTRAGIDVLRRGGRPGIDALLAVSDLSAEALDTEAVAFRLAPRLNAAGRMDHPGLALDLLLQRSPAEARETAVRLDRLNRERRETETAILAEAEERLTASGDPRHRHALVVAGPDWHEGVLGIVASRLARRFHRPAVVLSGRDGRLKGSARSIPGIDLYAALQQAAAHLDRFGGHPMAAGLQLDAARLDPFRLDLEASVAAQAPAAAFVRRLTIDAPLPLAQVAPAFLQALETLAPFGNGNPEPVFAAEDVSVRRVRCVGGRHRRLSLAPAGSPQAPAIPAMHFNVDLSQPPPTHLAHLAFRLRWNQWNGRRTLQLVIAEA